ncbi:hypothetical protein H310_06288 [Aphanomyces invadans]|uniref:Uncharacterized protein n=1 Tax=Aphanomyces invadans TaxID=157072 RepID=A0A024U6Z2_9STRA|nr:hypothetical protein H310_06288 [Aphanomyces invadans]ETW01667.1 hypothetical protein H310_06288 [Aphanomyces invadans]|eukprot:XP_008869515.1 hypothetical protein H310_06288 [Aphanomyces invadans]
MADEQVKVVWTTLKVPVIWKSFYYAVEVRQFSPEFLGTSAPSVKSLVYNTWFTAMPFRAILMRAQICLAVVSIAEVLLVTRSNAKMGISDGSFVLLESMFGEVVGRLIAMPVLVLCAKMCPRGIEGTFSALLMANMNLNYSVSSQKYDQLRVAILIRSTMMLLPLGSLWLPPANDPADEVEAATHCSVVPATVDIGFRTIVNDDDDGAGMLGGKQHHGDM